MGWIAGAVAAVVILFVIFTVLSGIRIVRPTHRGLVERLGKYNRYANPGIHLTIPYGIERMYQVDIREVLVEAQPQTIITNDNLNAKVDAQVYLKVKADEENVKASIYNVTNYELQIVNLSRTTLRNIIGTMTLKSANSERGKINEELRGTLKSETASWGIEILRTELKEIDPPPDVQETMNKVVKAENEKIAAVDFATATETQADGQRRAEIKKAEGIRQAKILEAEGEAQAIQLVNEAADKYFVGNAQMLRKLEAVERALYQNSKIVVPSDTQLVNVIGDLGGLLPMASDGKHSRRSQAARVPGARRPCGDVLCARRACDRLLLLGRQRAHVGERPCASQVSSAGRSAEHRLGTQTYSRMGRPGMGSKCPAPGNASSAARSSSPKPHEQVLLVDAGEHVAAAEEAGTAEHAPHLDARVVGYQAQEPIDQVLRRSAPRRHRRLLTVA